MKVRNLKISWMFNTHMKLNTSKIELLIFPIKTAASAAFPISGITTPKRLSHLQHS